MPTKIPAAHQCSHHLQRRALAVILSALLLSACTEPTNSQPATGDTITLPKQAVMTVKMVKYQPSFAFVGVITPIKKTTLTALTPASISSISVQAGDSVKKGDVLLTYLPDTLAQSNQSATPFELTAPFDGTIDKIFAQTNQSYDKADAWLEISDTSQLKFISQLSASLLEHIQVGDAVNFGVDGVSHTGQISQVDIDKDNPNLINVHVIIDTTNDETADLLGRGVVGHINYGQIQVGVVMPADAVYDAALQPADLSLFLQPPHKPATPVDGFVWVIKQDHSLSLSAVKLVEYYPKTQQFLVQGITEDSLVSTAKLDKQAHGKQVMLQ
ncbi:HlyD family efflux transporter periplasmic adaptor subunit [Moraxella cuniculi]|uniref:Efflux transporter, RND family, MFP subunit n=1 Tax=Moraxella cuniculi TaxID=34061 RepID=A0A3S4UJP4_9GAMM|nr:HlyD family efflux transporter periplasmic adaptor subunit [Moraxella cuniculi]VEG12392.1 efflux transporter, RND family, MFP subunit [Moraxella cuniculi]